MSDVADSSKRTSERVPIDGTVTGQIKVFEPLIVVQVSTKGATIETSFPVQIDSLHEVRLTLGDTSIVLNGRVVHSHVSEINRDTPTYRTGLEFVEPPEPVLRVLTTFLEELKTRRPPASTPADELRMDLGRPSENEVT